MRAVWVAVLLSGCACAEEIAAGVRLIVEDASGQPISGAQAVYRGADGEEHDCDAEGGGEYACAWGEDGAIDVRATATGYEWADWTTVDVDRGKCGPLTEVVDIVLDLIPPG